MDRQTYKDLTHEFREDAYNSAQGKDTLASVGRSWLRKQLGHDKTLMPPVIPAYMWTFWTEEASRERRRLQAAVQKAKQEGSLPEGTLLSTMGLSRYTEKAQSYLQTARESWTTQLP